MDLEEVVRSRKSVRKFQDRSVEAEKISKCLDAARLAPSWKNRQCWHFIVVRDKETIAKLATNVAWSWAKSVPVMIAACGNPELSGNTNGQMYYLVDVTIAMEHLVLEAVNLGLGTCWLGTFDERRVKELLKIPEEIRVVALTPLGYPLQSSGDESEGRPRKNLVEIVYGDEWGNHFDRLSRE